MTTPHIVATSPVFVLPDYLTKTYRCTQPHPAATGGRECKVLSLGYWADGTPRADVQFIKGYRATLPTSVLVSVK